MLQYQNVDIRGCFLIPTYVMCILRMVAANLNVLRSTCAAAACESSCAWVEISPRVACVAIKKRGWKWSERHDDDDSCALLLLMGTCTTSYPCLCLFMIICKMNDIIHSYALFEFIYLLFLSSSFWKHRPLISATDSIPLHVRSS